MTLTDLYLTLNATQIVLRDSNRTEQIHVVEETTGRGAFQRVLDRLRTTDEGRELLRLRPELSERAVDYDALRRLPRHTLGGAYVRHLDDNGLSAELQASQTHHVSDPDIAYLMRRFRQTHDVWHPLTTLGVQPHEEVIIHAFSYGQLRLPVSAMPLDGTFPTGTARHEKRNIALEIPVWEADLCTQCGKCVFVCPHSAIRARAFPLEAAADAPPTFKHVPARSKDFPAGTRISYQVAPEDCTGCGDCVEACPIHDKSNISRLAVNMAPLAPLRDAERANFDFFLTLPEYDRSQLKQGTLPGAMLLDPLFEFSGACAGCGETPYIRLATQLFGDRMLVANATGCSSIYGANLPSTPYTVNGAGRGPAWSNSLFEDNAEFGLGMRLAADQLMLYANQLVQEMASDIGGDLAQALITAEQRLETGIRAQRERVAELRGRLARSAHPRAAELASVAEWLIRRSVWIIGGDGWAYDIGYGGLDHVLALSHDVNILVLDTEVYSNTGGQTSKATPVGAVARFSAGGKATAKKDLARIASDYGHVYVATVAYGAKDVHTLKVFHEAEAYTGPSLIVAYSPCIAHGVDMLYNQRQQDMAVKSGHWPLFRHDPRLEAAGANPFKLDSAAPSQPMQAFMDSETRFAMLARSHPDVARRLAVEAQREADQRYRAYQELAARPATSKPE